MRFKRNILMMAGAALLSTSAMAQDTSMSFFITSKGSGDGGNLGGLAGADMICKSLATAAGQGDKDWKAYLSTNGDGGVNARDRIGQGPWYNAKGVMVARDVDDLHSDNNKLSKENSGKELYGYQKEALELLSEIYKNLGEYREALLNYEQFKWDNRSVLYYIDDEGQLVLRINEDYTYPTGV